MTELTTIRVIVPAALLDRAYALNLDIPKLMVEALEQRVAATRVVEVTTTVSGDTEEAGAAPLLTVPINPQSGFPL